MLDVHIIVRHDMQPEWIGQCVSSVITAAADAGFHVGVYIVPAVPGYIGLAREHGYSMGKHPYVTYVDDDDYVLPNAFAVMAPALKETPDAIFMAETTLQNGQFRDGEQRHHLCIYRREHLIDHSMWVVCGDLRQMNAMEGKRCIDVPERVYVHRLYQSGGRALRREHHDELRAARG